MPVARSTGEQDPAAIDTQQAPGVPVAAVPVVLLASALVTALAVAVAKRTVEALAAPGLNAPSPVRDADRLIAAFDATMVAAVVLAVGKAYRRGQRAAHQDAGSPGSTSHADVLIASIRATYPRLRQWAGTSHLALLAAAANPGARSPEQAAQAVWDRTLTRGVTGFVDPAGRSWGLTEYVEVATRTALVHAAVQGTIDTLIAHHQILVIVSATATVCPICLPWAGQVLALTGPAGERDVGGVRVKGTFREAITDGLLHPQCRHTVEAFTGQPVPTHIEDPDGDAHTRGIRAIARHVRQWELRADAALTGDARKQAGQRASAWRAALAHRLH
jgi:hypothetical protein